MSALRAGALEITMTLEPPEGTPMYGPHDHRLAGPGLRERALRRGDALERQGSPVTFTGNGLSTVVPSPSCPRSFLPQHHTVLSALRAHT